MFIEQLFSLDRCVFSFLKCLLNEFLRNSEYFSGWVFVFFIAKISLSAAVFPVLNLLLLLCLAKLGLSFFRRCSPTSNCSQRSYSPTCLQNSRWLCWCFVSFPFLFQFFFWILLFILKNRILFWLLLLYILYGAELVALPQKFLLKTPFGSFWFWAKVV